MSYNNTAVIYSSHHKGSDEPGGFSYYLEVFMKEDVGNSNVYHKFSVKTAILIDGGFYRKRAYYLWGDKTPKERADELNNFCLNLLKNHSEYRQLYRIFYYDCPPINKKVYHPLLKKTVDLGKSEEYKWSMDFFNELRCRRKFAVRLGSLSENTAHYSLKTETTKKLLNGSITVNDLQESDFQFHLEQKGVDMRIGVDIISMALKKQVDQIILVSGDSDFVPAAKQGRREGLDIILAPMGATIKPDLHEHIDGLINSYSKPNISK